MMKKFNEQLKKDLRGNKNIWVFLNYKIGENYIQIKVYNKYLQIFNCNGSRGGGMEFATKKELMEEIITTVERCINENWCYAVDNINHDLEYIKII